MIKLVQSSGQFPGLWTGLLVDIQFQPVQQLQCFIDIAVPEKLFHSLQIFLELFSLLLNRNPFRHLIEHSEAHRNVEPV